MKKVFFVLMVMFMGVNVYSQANSNQDAQWDFFSNVIPKYNSITISGSAPSNHAKGSFYGGDLNWRMTIDDKYKVSFSGNIAGQCRGHDNIQGTVRAGRDEFAHYIAYPGRGGATVTYSGTGSLIWDNNKMKIMLTINASGKCSGSFHIVPYYKERKQREQEEYMETYGNQTFNLIIDLEADNSNNQMKFLLSQNRLALNMYGEFRFDLYGKDININYPCTNSTTLGGNTWYTASAIRKSESEINSSSNNQLGEWNGNAYYKLINLAMSFYGSPAKSFSSIVNK
jgi:hypothetical protein